MDKNLNYLMERSYKIIHFIMKIIDQPRPLQYIQVMELIETMNQNLLIMASDMS